MRLLSAVLAHTNIEPPAYSRKLSECPSSEFNEMVESLVDRVFPVAIIHKGKQRLFTTRHCVALKKDGIEDPDCQPKQWYETMATISETLETWKSLKPSGAQCIRPQEDALKLLKSGSSLSEASGVMCNTLEDPDR